MTGVPTHLTPSQLMTLRFKAQSEEDFVLIYHSSHRLSTLRRSFPSLKDYSAFATENLCGHITITSFELLAEQKQDKKAYVLCKVSMSVQDKPETFVEIAELRRSVLGWRFLHCARLPLARLPEDPHSADLKALSAHPEAVVY